MNEVNSFLDSLQQGLNSVTSTWQKATELIASITGGNQTIGGIIVAIVVLALTSLAVYVATNVFGG